MKLIYKVLAFAMLASSVGTANAVCIKEPVQESVSTLTPVLSDSTLRIDYIFGGTINCPTVSLSKACKSAGWYGRTTNLDSLVYRGNGQVTVTSTETGDTLYRTSFSSLYSEWLDLADSVERAFEHTVLTPLPRQKATIDLELFNHRGQVIAKHSHTYLPGDVLIRPVEGSSYPTTTLHNGNFEGHRINVVILPEGYATDEMEMFRRDSQTAADEILNAEPFSSFVDRFNFIAVEVPSKDNGVSVPRLGQWKDTAFGSHFSTFYSDRYLTTPNVFAIHDALTGIPYEHIIILANTDEYGGGGIYNSYTLTTAHHPNFKPVVVHEFGHSFGGLADEYYYEDDVMSDSYPTDVEPWEPNVTTLVDFASKWKDALTPDTPVPTPAEDSEAYPLGVFEGAAYSFHGVYRPAIDCRMKTNTATGFCPGCRRALTRLILFYTE